MVLSVFTVVFPLGSQWPAEALSDSKKGHVLDLLSSGDLVSSDYSLWSGCSSNTKTIPQFCTWGSEAIYIFPFIISIVSVKKGILNCLRIGFVFSDSRNPSI